MAVSVTDTDVSAPFGLGGPRPILGPSLAQEGEAAAGSPGDRRPPPVEPGPLGSKARSMSAETPAPAPARAYAAFGPSAPTRRPPKGKATARPSRKTASSAAITRPLTASALRRWRIT